MWKGAGGGWLEAPHIYHVNGYYYLLAAEGGTGYGHMSTLARSKDILGCYEACPQNPILTNRNDTSKQALCCGHADLIDDINGNWWLVHLGTRPAVGANSHLGRETFLTPAEWKDGWFMAADGKAKIKNDISMESEQKQNRQFIADFTKSEWEKQWMFLKKPVTERYKRGNGVVALAPSTDKLTGENSFPTFAAVRQPDFECEITSEFEFETSELGDEAGLAVYLNPKFMYRICRCREADGDYIYVIKTADDLQMIAYKRKTTADVLCFQIKADKEKYEFYCSVGENMEFISSASARFLSCEIADKCFTGTVIGIYAQSDRKTLSRALFNRFWIK